MIKTIYADVLFIINLIINYLLLFVTAHIATLNISRFRILLSSSVGALYSVLTFLPSLFFLKLLPIKLIVAAMLVFISFGKSVFFRAYLTFFISALAFAGVAFFISALAPNVFFSSGGVYYINLSLPLLLLSTAISYLLLRIAFRGRSRGERRICKVKITLSGAESFLHALYDTGNSLRAPGTNARVVISGYDAVKSLFPHDIREILDGCNGNNFALALDKLPKNFSLIPYKTVGVSFSLLLAFAPDEVYIDKTLSHGALCAISEAPVSDGSGYNAII